MKDEIIQNINNPEMLEMLYRKDKTAFMRVFGEAASGTDTELVKFWQIRLRNTDQTRLYPEVYTGLAALAVIIVMTALLVKLPFLLAHMNPEDFYLRNFSVIILAGLTAWSVASNRITSWKNILLLALPTVALVFFLNLLPENKNDTANLAFIHAPLFMGFIFALASVSLDFRNHLKVSVFIRYCGELVIMTGLLTIAGAILSGMTISLFAMIGTNIEKFYTENVVIVGLAVLPVIAAWLVGLYPGIADRIASVIARVFTPLALLSASIYLVAISLSGLSLSENRELLLSFNIMLLCVMAIIVFSLSGLERSGVRRLNVILLFLLAAVTLSIDIFALSAIVTRLSEGFTPNRTAVLISNVLILLNLLLILPDLYLSGFSGKPLDRMERTIHRYLPVYFIYSVVVIFIFPLVF